MNLDGEEAELRNKSLRRLNKQLFPLTYPCYSFPLKLTHYSDIFYNIAIGLKERNE